MTILFICAGLEPGRDGVGDYTLRLAAACVARGHRCMILAVHDPAVDRVLDDRGAPATRRLPSSSPWSDRIDAAARTADAFRPEWISWQFVAYGYTADGRVPTALYPLAERLRGVRQHVMLHELWLGLERGAGPCARFRGARQRHSLRGFLGTLRPAVLHTSNPAYRAALRAHGEPAALLPLFGNIPVAPAEPVPPDPLVAWLAGRDAARRAVLVALAFGTVHPQWRPAATIGWLLRTAAARAQRPRLLLAGRNGRHAPALAADFTAAGVEVTLVGEQAAPIVSGLLRHSDFGLALHPRALVGKSGVVAAMLEHGLPVLMPRDDWQLRGAPAPDTPPAEDRLLAPLAGLNAARTARWLARRRPPAPALPAVADAFLAALAGAAVSAASADSAISTVSAAAP